jgi:hypothetical protein
LVVLVERTDLVAQLGSLRRANALGAWHVDRNTRPPPDGQVVRIAAGEFARYGAEVVRLGKVAPAAADYIADYAALRRLQDVLQSSPRAVPAMVPAAAESRPVLREAAER